MRCHLRRLCSLLVALCCCFLLGLVNILRVQEQEDPTSRGAPDQHSFLPRRIESVAHLDKYFKDTATGEKGDEEADKYTALKGDAMHLKVKAAKEESGEKSFKRHINIESIGDRRIAKARKRDHVNKTTWLERSVKGNDNIHTGKLAHQANIPIEKHDNQHNILDRTSNGFELVNLPDIALYPNRSKGLSLFPNPSNPYDDRIIEQLSFNPPEAKANAETEQYKMILAFSGTGGAPEGREQFQKEKCAVDACFITTDVRWAHKADAVLFNFDPGPDTWEKPWHQVWVLFQLESPLHTPTLTGLQDSINWTATYRPDSTLVTPYEKFQLFPNSSSLPKTPLKNYAATKTKKVAWFVSNCNPRNRRSEFVRELQKYIDVDVYGACGTLQCEKDSEGTCNQMLKREYKFYLAFENSNCRYYITEKFYWNALWNDVVPVVMGASRKDYAAMAPPGSFIHVEDFPTVRELAQYLDTLDKNDTLYNQHFAWKQTGHFVNTKYWCRLCALLNQKNMPRMWYSDIESWWRSPGACTNDRWDSRADMITNWGDVVL